MTQLIIRLLFISILFSSANVAAEAVCFEFDDHQNQNSSVLDQESTTSVADDQSDCCDQFCQCLAQVGLIFTYSSCLTETNHSKNIINYYNYHSRSLSTPFRPPIV